MSDQPTISANEPAQSKRSLVLLVDCLSTGDGSTFGEGTEGQFLLRLAALLASGWAGRVLVLKVVAVPEGESISAYSTRTQALRQKLERETLEALAGSKEQAFGFISPVVRVARESRIGQEVRAFLELRAGRATADADVAACYKARAAPASRLRLDGAGTAKAPPLRSCLGAHASSWLRR